MKKRSAIYFAAAVMLVLNLGITNLNADSIRTINPGEVITKSMFYGGKELTNEGEIKGDLIAGAKRIESSGTIDGDLIVGASDITSTGIINGDILFGAEIIDISSDVAGDIRGGGAKINVSGKVSRNANLFGESVKLKRKSVIGRNLIAFAEYLRIDGKVKGYTRLGGNRIILSGEFFGDVDINTDFFWDEGPEAFGTITILPETKIHGRLTYRADEELEIPEGAMIKSVKWIESKPKHHSKHNSPKAIVWDFFKVVLNTAVYFLISLLILKLLPNVFRHLSDSINETPLKTAGIGFLTVLGILAIILGLIVLAIFSYLFNALSLTLFTVSIISTFYTMLFYLATIPVALWLGNYLAKERYNLPTRFGLGLSIVAALKFVLDLLGAIPVAGGIFEFLNFLLAFAILLLGIGALITMSFMIIKSVRNFDPGVE